MPTVAIAGGTSAGLGRSIVTAINNSKSYTPIVLSRSTSSTPQWLLDLGDVQVHKVDYGSEESLFRALQGVQTVIVTLWAKDGTWCSTQLRLLNASLRAGVKRFAPAEFDVGTRAATWVSLLAEQAPVIEACRAARKSHPGFEFARFAVGVFMNFLGYGAKDKEARGGVTNESEFLFYVKEMKVVIPLVEGKEAERVTPRLTMTEMGDVGRFVAAACELPMGTWVENMNIVGDTKRMSEIVDIIEKVKKQKVNVEYKTAKGLREDVGKAKQAGDSMGAFFSQLVEMCTRDAESEGWLQPVVNSLCPSVKPMSIEEFLTKFWGEPTEPVV